MAKDQVRSYQQVQKSNLTPREAEAAAFTKAALMLEAAKGGDGYAQALRFNHLLWTIIQADITEPENQLSAEIRANILSLSIFVDKQTAKAMSQNNPADVDVLININRNLAAGLRNDSATNSEAANA